MSKYKLYGHTGSYNHGCEALVRSAIKFLDNEKVTLFTTAKNEDVEFNIDKIAYIKHQKIVPENTFQRIVYVLKSGILNRLLNRHDLMAEYQNKPFVEDVASGDICLSIGGDNYCYAGWENFGDMKNIALSKGAKAVLWGCSVEPDDLHANKAMQQDISGYSLITARETYSYEALKQYNPNTVLTVDTAFILDKEAVELPAGFEIKKTIGINVSPLVQSLEKGENMVMANYCHLIEWILENTDEKIALIPHVVWSDNNDEIPLKELYEKYKDSGRVIWAGGHYNCMQLKYIISNCSCFIGARTHSTIAAYSTGVPTLVSGYSIKARGIAKDLFGTDEGYVVSVQKMKEKDELAKAFEKIYLRKEEIAEYLKETLPAYKAKLDDVYKLIKQL